MSEVFEATAEDEESDDVDVTEVQNYVSAFELGRSLREDLPLSLRLARRVHERLLTGVRGEEKTPGEFRTSQDWIGRPGGRLAAATFVPPRHDPEVTEALADWERFLHERDSLLPPVVRRDRDAYYDRLQGVRERGAMQDWLRYFLDGVAHQANDAVNRAEQLTDLQHHYRAELSGDRSNAVHLVDHLFSNPVMTTVRASRELDMTAAGALNVIRKLEQRGWLHEARTVGRGGRITWIASDILEVLTGALDGHVP